MSPYAALESAIGYSFNRSDLLEEAMTHPSYSRRNKDAVSYQRLEFLGDAAIGFIMAEYLYETMPDQREGYLTMARAAITQGSALQEMAGRLQLDKWVRWDGELSSLGFDSMMEDAFEALLGAIYLDGGLNEAREFVLRIFKDVEGEVLKRLGKLNPKGQLQERTQSTDASTLPEYKIIKEKGPPHDRSFIASVSIEGREQGRGEGRSKKEAEENAALTALQSLDP